MDSCYSSSFQVWKKKEADMMMWCMDRFPTRNGLATSTANLWALSTPPPLKQSAAAVDKLMGVRCNGRGVNSVTYPSFLRIGPNIKMTGAQSGRSWRCSPSHRHSYTGLMSRFQWRWRFFFSSCRSGACCTAVHCKEDLASNPDWFQIFHQTPRHRIIPDILRLKRKIPFEPALTAIPDRRALEPLLP